jgi:hypothetical protein
MPWVIRLSFLSSAIAAFGISLLIYAHFLSGWDAITYFGWGLLITGSGLLGSLILSAIGMIAKGGWRRFALIECLVCLLLLVGLVILWVAA